MARMLRESGVVYDVRPTGEHGGLMSGPFGNLLGIVKDSCQGACAGFLAMLGATHLSTAAGGVGSLSSEIGMLDAVWQSLALNGLAGPVEVLGGIVLFFAARRTISRTIGLLGFIGVLAAYANGYSTNDMIFLLSEILERASGLLQSIPVVEGQ